MSKVFVFTKYNLAWAKNRKYLKQGNNEFQAYSNLCRVSFSIAHSGLGDVKQHEERTKHVQANKDQKTSVSIVGSVVRDSPEDLKVIAAEATVAFHTIKSVSKYSFK